jgi:pimeloyl-ACP methyl ester carboxylesterase
VALVLIPGFMADRELWTLLEPKLDEFGPIVHADISKDDSILAMARRVLTDSPKEKFMLIGFSLGGYVAREVARLAPDRANALVLVATSSRGDTAGQARRKASATGIPARPFKGLSRSSIAESLHPSRVADTDLIASIREMGARLGHDTFLRQSRLARESDFKSLGEIRCPTLIVAAEQDRIRSLDEALELNIGIPNSTLEIIRECGHMIPMEQPSALATLIKRWQRDAIKKARALSVRSL